MPEHIVTILMKEFVTHDTLRFITTKPKSYSFTPGQATEVAINHPDWRDKKRPFTFSSLNNDKVLEFTIKIYPTHNVTHRMNTLVPGDTLAIGDVWGSIKYKGPGVFIAGGAGITPFIAILRELKEKNQLTRNTLIFSNKEHKDIMLESELSALLNENAIFTLTKEQKPGYHNGRVDKAFLQQHVHNFDQQFYICGPMQFIVDVKCALDELGAKPESITIEL